MAPLCSEAVQIAPLRLCFYLLFYLLLLSLFTHITSALITYDKGTILDIGHRYTNLFQDTLSPNPSWPLEILQNAEENNGHRRRNKKHRGKRAGIRNRLRKWAQSPPLPSILLANVQSLENKIDDLRASISFQWDIRDCNIICLTETWLTPSVPDTAVTPSNKRVSSFKYLGVNISEDLTWTTYIQTHVKKARQRLYHLRQLRKFRVSPTILKTFYSGTIESVLTQCISVWYGNSSSQDCKALQRVVRLAERISESALPSLQDIYLKRCRSRAVKIIKDSNHPGNCLFTLLPYGKRFRSLMAKTERLRRSFFPQAIRLLNSNSAS